MLSFVEKRIFPWVDLFALKGHVPVEASPVNRPSCVGAMLSLLAVVSLAVLGLFLYLARSENNTLAQNSLGVLKLSTWVDTEGWRWKTAPLAGLTSPVQGIVVRVHASGEPGACALPLAGALSTSGTTGGSWSLSSSTPACGLHGVSSFSLTCGPSCFFSSSSKLSFALHYSCQSLLLQVAAVDAQGKSTLLNLPAALTQGAPESFLTAIEWGVGPLYSIVNDTVGDASVRGYQAVDLGSSVSTTRLVNASGGGGVLIAPLASAISVKFAFTLETFVSVTTLTQIQTITGCVLCVRVWRALCARARTL